MPDISFSKMKLWRKCHYAFHLKYNEHLRKKRPTRPLITGTILHEMLHARTLSRLAPNSQVKSPETVLRSYEKKYRLMFREEQELYGNDFIPNLLRIYQGYERYWADDGLDYLATEEPVMTDLTKEIRFIGYIDRRVRDTQGLHFLSDTKTHRSIPNDDDRFSDLQLVFYVWAWNRENPNKKVDGVLWDYLRTKPPAIPELLKNGELTKRANIDTDYFTYRKAIDDNDLNPKDYTDILGMLQKKETGFYKRVFLPSPRKQMVETIVEDLKSTALQIIYLKKDVRDRNMTKDCPRTCEYYQLCQAELRGLDADFIRKSQYKVEEKDNADQEEE